MRYSWIILFIVITTSAFARGQKVTWDNIDWEVIHSEHFDIHYPKGYEKLGKITLKYAEEANILISNRLGHNLSEVIPVYIYPSHGHFQATNITHGQISEGIGGFTEPMKRRVVLPFMGSYDDFRHVLTHELVHAFQFDILLTPTAGSLFGIPAVAKAPLWFIEGSAEYISQGWDSRTEMVVREAVLAQQMPSVMDMTIMRIRSSFILYKGGQSVIRYISETYGNHKVGELLRDIRDQNSFEDALKTNLGITIQEFNEEWMLWLQRMYYPYIEKKSEYEESKIITKHFEDKSFMNLHPSISPDGKKIVYVTIRDMQEVIILRDIDTKKSKPDYALVQESALKKEKEKKKSEKILLRAGDNAKFFQLHLLDNKITFTKDSKSIFFCARSQGKDRLYLFNIKKKKVTKSWSPDLDMVQYPALSDNGKLAVFAGSSKGNTDLYILELSTSKITKLSNNMFSEKDPRFTADGKSIIYSSNENKGNNIESQEYNIFLLNIASKESTQIVNIKGSQRNPRALRNDPDTIVFISDHSGVPNAYKYDVNTKETLPMTDIYGGVPAIDFDSSGKKIVYLIYRKQGYDIGVKEESIEETSPPATVIKNKIFPQLPFPKYPVDLNQFKPKPYKAIFSLDSAFFGMQIASGGQWGGFLYGVFSEYMGNHRIEIFMDYFSGQIPNFQIKYSYLKNRLNWHFGAYHARNFYSILNLLDLASINDFIYNPYFFTKSIVKYGGYVMGSYPWTPFFSTSLGFDISRYEETFYKNVPSEYVREDINTNIFASKVNITYNNVLYSYMGPLKGHVISLQDEQSANITGSDFVYNRLSFQFRKYFLFAERFVFATRFMIGTITGPQSEFFPWQLGGYNSIRGYNFFSISGKHSFVANLEFRFPLLDFIVMGFPTQWLIHGITATAFLDIGSAFNDASTYDGYDDSAQRLKDLKASIGLGLRMVLVPGIFMKIDWATPWDLQDSLPIAKWVGIFSIGYEF